MKPTLPNNWRSTTLLFLLLAAQCISAQLAWGEAKIDLKNNNGTTCSISVQNDAKLLKDTSCKNDEVYYFKLAEVLAGTKISFYDHNSRDSCSTTGWWFTVEAANFSTSTGWVKFSDLRDKSENEMITAGLFLVRKKGEIKDGNLSCVRSSNFN
ncbi:hypothetical protein [Pseudomonas oryziphila]|uniref:Uncharacterized protein n=1 Tax=Pseudomonas oryziphila TaxID=2894079 RepID=A0ABN5TDG8_9PSED|nr:hypothetical protein [Pseudomonas oryziphila]AZL73015.1 hypothetical protein EI693_07855 [Pseudomonas oryziphila]